MTAAIWFGLAAIALVGAIVLLYFDRVQRQRTGHVRQVWAKSQGYTYVSVEPSLASTWRRGAMAKLGYLSAIDVVSGNRKGEKFVLFDLEDAATLVAVRRQIGSDIDIDLRLKTASPPKDADLELLGAIGDRVVFATNPDVARHAVDQRMVHFIETLPSTVQQLWSEGNWTLGMLPVGTVAKDWEAAIDSVLRLSGLLHVLPPVAGGDRGRLESDQHDPGRPRPNAADEPGEADRGYGDRYRDEAIVPARGDDYDDRRGDRFERFDDDEFEDRFEDEQGRGDRFGDDRFGDDRDFRDERAPRPRDGEARGGQGRVAHDDVDGIDRADTRRGGTDAPAGPRPGDTRDAGERQASDAVDREGGVIAPPVGDPADEAEQQPPRRPALAVVPDPRNRVRRNWPPAEEFLEGEETDSAAEDFDEPHAEDELPQRPGGPFHPGFRPYQGPAPR
ncbi:hypothetical protein [Nocardia sp. MDA0666]|uniref:hypothetical protein n=1 Tax=Nocardia sp. MDA0666 TaxID=2135448 RepID=UPI001E599B4C|nr:hypothetical protein [Nocardia sp. MDA0666]